jgi:hypothetical protein
MFWRDRLIATACPRGASWAAAVLMDDAEQLGGVMLERLAELFDEDRGANTRV